MDKLNDELYKRFNGLLPIKRENPKRGQSQWYYMMPIKGSDEDNPEYDIIDVPTQDTPNPMINKHPEEYYIWRTCGDDKVRTQHQSRDGQIFSWNNPPEGGHPGEDYNCRCHAEPYVPKVNDNKENKTMVDDYAHRYVKFRSAAEEKLLTRIGQQIIARGNTKEYVYLDSSGYITTGNGALIDDWNSFKKVHWLYYGRPATEEEMWAEYTKMQKVKDDIIARAKAFAAANNKPYTNPFQKITSDKYKKDSVLYITKEESDYLMYSHLQKDYDNLKHYLPEFDNAPQAAQDVAFDIQYNSGITSTTWKYFKEYFNEKNVKKLAEHVHRIGVSEKRNNEMRDKILSINRW